jgi:hypothetical protein
MDKGILILTIINTILLCYIVDKVLVILNVVSNIPFATK